ncbi:X-Pro dipeptidyl-peptidase [Filimonas lacunae]|nr:X-Pro dipeptidyl-peptidase [Filimonas lacunae]
MMINRSSAQVADMNVYEQTSEVNNLMVQYQADRGSLERFYHIEFLPERRQRLQQMTEGYVQRVARLPFDQLNTGAKVDYVLFKRDLEETLFQLKEEAAQYEAVKQWFPYATQLYSAVALRSRGALPDAAKMAGEWNNIAKDIVLQQKALAQKGPASAQQCIAAIHIITGLSQAVKSVYEFYNGYDPLFTWWMPQPYEKLQALLQEEIAFFKEYKSKVSTQEKDGSGIVGNPIGREALVRKLKLEMIPYTPEELLSIADKEFAWCDKEMLKASNEMGFGNDWHAAMEKVKNSYVTPGNQPTAMLQLYNESVDFIKQHDLITLPPLAEETWRMSMMSPERQLVNPFFLGGEEFIISYPTNTMSHDDKLMSMRGNNPHFSRATVHHELLAGHALQEFMQSRYKSYRHFETPFWIEGWALYWERLLWDLKFPQSPEDRIGMLFWRMHRCARIIFSINYHTGKWTPQQCINFLVERVGHEKANAEGEVRRSFVGGYDPLYQIAYMMGGLQFEALRKELVDGGKMTYKQFHDAIIKENMMPVEMVRAILTNQPPKKDFVTSWRFYK